MSRPKHQPIDREYFKYLKPDSLLSTKDLLYLFNFKNVNSIAVLVNTGKLPKHDKELPAMKYGKKNCFYWRVKTIMDYINSNFGVEDANKSN